MPCAYQFAPIFLIRLAGVPFDPLERLATPETAGAARQLLVRQGQAQKTKSQGLNDDDIKLRQLLAEELQLARQELVRSVQKLLPQYLVFAGTELGQRLLRQLSASSSPATRNKEARARERTALLYLQRVCAKNDSLSAFGPAGWGRIDEQVAAVRLAPASGIAQRECFLERWTAHGAAAALNADAEIRAELAPRLNPNGQLAGEKFVFVDSGEIISVDSASKEILRRCDGKTPAHLLGVDLHLLDKLAQQNLIRWEIEVPALDPYAFQTLVHDISLWRDNFSRRRWLDLLQPIADLPAEFAQDKQISNRVEIMNRATTKLDQLGAHHASTGRFLYAATNPIGEECLRECDFLIGEELIDQVVVDAARWIDLWRDCYAFVASRVAEGLRQIFKNVNSEAIPLPKFLRLCEQAKLSLSGPGLVALAHIGFQEVKTAFRELIGDRAMQPECELTADDCHFVRRHFQYPKFDEYTYPSADLQLAAKSIDAIERGEYQWILAELHPPVALLHHGFYWSCPNKPALSQALASTVFGKPNFYFGFSAADFTSTTAVRIFDALPDLTYFVAPLRGNPNWRTISPAAAEAYVDDATGDICLRKIDDRKYLGSFARAWLIPLGFHPFQFGMAPHMPRLRCGKVIVQRRAWAIRLDELGKGDFTGVSRDLVLAVERLRAARDLSRFIYIRPTEQALRRSGAEGRDKDTKPVFIDLESYLFLEIFLRWLTKAGEIEATEMLPAPDDLFWQEADGRRSFELRTQIVPRR